VSAAHFRMVTFYMIDPQGQERRMDVIVPVEEINQIEEMIETLGLIAGEELETNGWRLKDVTVSCPSEFADQACENSPINIRDLIGGKWLQVYYLWRRSLVDRNKAEQEATEESEPEQDTHKKRGLMSFFKRALVDLHSRFRTAKVV